MIQAEGKNRTAFWLGIIVGLVGLFGIGHLYLGRRQRGVIFLVWSAVLYIDALAGLFVSQLWQSPFSPAIVFGLGWVVQTYDLYNLTKKATQEK
jgi:hypothetical protein